MKKLLLLLALCGCMLLGACQKTDLTQGATATGYDFVEKLVNRDYESAYDYVYVYSSDVKNKEDFAGRFNSIYDALQISDIKLSSRNVEKKSESEFTLNYTLEMNSALLGTLYYDFETEIVSGPNGFTVLYTPDLILPMLEDGDRVRVSSQTGKRGEIFSADGVLLAQNGFADSIYVDFDKSPDYETIKNFLVTNYELDEAKIKKKYDNAVEKGYPLEVMATFPKGTVSDVQIGDIQAVQGLGFDNERLSPIRHYPLRDVCAHVVGYVGSPSEEQMEKDPTLNEYSIVGKSGIEGQYEEQLRGTNGTAVYIEDDKGKIKQMLYEEMKLDGSDIYLTIDSRTQTQAYTLLATNLVGGQTGAAIVMNPKTGEVEAMVSYPSFDNNLFNFPMQEKTWKYLTSEEAGVPLLNRATQSALTPGSSFKPFSSIPMFESGVMTEGSTPPINIVENKWTPDRAAWNWVYPPLTRYRPPTGGAYVFETAMKSSDNIFFAYYAMKTGQETFLAFLDRIGIGDAPQFELPLTKSRYLNEGSEMNIKLLADMGFGMGELLVTPTQVASMYTAFENDGDILNPTIVKRIVKTISGDEQTEYENSRTVFKEGIMSGDVQATIKTAMRRVFEDGTAYPAKLAGKGIYGKTGTAVIGARELNWVIGIDSANEKEYLVMVDSKKNEGSVPKLGVIRGLIDSENYDKALASVVPVGSDHIAPRTSAPESDNVETNEDDNQNTEGNGNGGGEGGNNGGEPESGGEE